MKLKARELITPYHCWIFTNPSINWPWRYRIQDTIHFNIPTKVVKHAPGYTSTLTSDYSDSFITTHLQKERLVTRYKACHRIEMIFSKRVWHQQIDQEQSSSLWEQNEEEPIMKRGTHEKTAQRGKTQKTWKNRSQDSKTYFHLRRLPKFRIWIKEPSLHRNKWWGLKLQVE